MKIALEIATAAFIAFAAIAVVLGFVLPKVIAQ